MHTVENGRNEWMTPSPSVTMTLPWGRAGLRARRTVWVQAWPRYKIISKKLLTLIDCFKIRGNLWGRSIIMCPYMQLFITLILPAYYFLPCEFLSFIKRASDHGMCKILVEITIGDLEFFVTTCTWRLISDFWSGSIHTGSQWFLGFLGDSHKNFISEHHFWEIFTRILSLNIKISHPYQWHL